ncbi:MAG: DUF4386 domain-containing protein [Dehalococcoidia bacterium]|nr:MAG: DUF4386 domain-containing protein [Dehalococcoidia bacterium]
MESERRTALVVGVLFILTFITSIGALPLYGPVLGDSTFVLGGGSDWSVSLGALLEVALIVTNIGTAVVLFPLLRRTSEGGALAYVTARVVESSIIAVGIVSLVGVMMLRREGVLDDGTDAASLVAVAKGLVSVHDATFLLGPAFMAPLGNGLILGWLMLRARLLPGRIALLGLVGGAFGLASATAVLFGVYPQMSAPSFLATLPEILWEGFLGIWLTVRGFRRLSVQSNVTAEAVGEVRAREVRAIA